MEITIIKSGSAGNGYLVEDGETAILIDAGVSYREINRKTGFRSSRLAGVLITHEHGDHTSGISTLDGVLACKIHMTQGTFDALAYKPMSLQIIGYKRFEIGTLAILPFPVEHDAADPVGFLIYSSVTQERLLFATDTAFLRFRFEAVDLLMIECNFDEQTLISNVSEGIIARPYGQRLHRSHMGLGSLIKMIEANAGWDLKRIYLLHMSNSNADEDLIKQKIAEVTGALVEVA